MNQQLTNTAATVLDGFTLVDDEGNESLIKGAKIKFTLDFKWVIASSGEVIDRQRKFLIIDIWRVLQKWLPGQNKPETRILAPGEEFTNLKELNDAAPRSEWREKFGKQVGPWQGAHVVYLIEQSDAVQAFTWIADIENAGASRAVRELRRSVNLTRRVRQQPNLFPLATLSDTFMPTQYGGRQRPHFGIVSYQPLGPEPAAPAQIELRDDCRDGDNHHDLGTGRRESGDRHHDHAEGAKPKRADLAESKPAKPKPALKDEMNDEIGF
jgi:hypothetical protein